MEKARDIPRRLVGNVQFQFTISERFIFRKQENEITNLRKSSVAKEVLITKQQYMLEKQASKINALEIQFEEIRASRHELESITRNINELQQKCDHTGKVNRGKCTYCETCRVMIKFKVLLVLFLRNKEI